MYGFVRDVVAEKGAQVHTVPVGASVREAAQAMGQDGIGSLLVTRLGQPVGIVAERDILQRVIVPGLDAERIPVGEVMMVGMPTTSPGTPVDEAMALMTRTRCRHLTVMDGARLAGIVSLGDLTRWVLLYQEEDLRRMSDYITGRVEARGQAGASTS